MSTEPTGLGAVVEDAHGNQWIRLGDGPAAWMLVGASPDNRDTYSYADIEATRVVMAGVVRRDGLREAVSTRDDNLVRALVEGISSYYAKWSRLPAEEVGPNPEPFAAHLASFLARVLDAVPDVPPDPPAADRDELARVLADAYDDPDASGISRDGDRTLPPIPLDDDMLDHIEWALDPSQHDDGRTHMGELLNFLSGYEPSKSVMVGEGDPMGLGIEGAPIYEYPDPLYSQQGLILALVAEVRRLRSDQEKATQ